MHYTNDRITHILTQACDMLIKHDSYLLEIQVNERSLTHRLAVYLESLFPEWHVDCEYNRNWKNIPKIIYTDDTVRVDDDKWKTAYPDIIIHKRGANNENLVVIEAKKDSKEDDDSVNYDRKKLEAYKKDYSYNYAFFIDFITWTKLWYKLSIMNENWELEIKHTFNFILKHEPLYSSPLSLPHHGSLIP